MAEGEVIKEGDNRGDGVRWGGGGEHGRKNGNHTGQGEREAFILSHSPLGWLAASAAAHYMLYLCSVDAQCTITPPRCSDGHVALRL